MFYKGVRTEKNQEKNKKQKEPGWTPPAREQRFTLSYDFKYDKKSFPFVVSKLSRT